MSQKHKYYMQQWFMDYSRASHVADDNGQRAFALVNKATGQAGFGEQGQETGRRLYPGIVVSLKI